MADDPPTFYGRRKSRRLVLLCFKHTDSQRNPLCGALIVAANQIRDRLPLSPPFRKDIFTEHNTGYNLKHGNNSQIPKVHTTTYRIETISFLGNRLLSTLPNIVKQASTPPIFKNHIKCWKGENCHCRLRKINLPHRGVVGSVYQGGPGPRNFRKMKCFNFALFPLLDAHSD